MTDHDKTARGEFVDFAVKVLKSIDSPLCADSIWQEGREMGLCEKFAQKARRQYLEKFLHNRGYMRQKLPQEAHGLISIEKPRISFSRVLHEYVKNPGSKIVVVGKSSDPQLYFLKSREVEIKDEEDASNKFDSYKKKTVFNERLNQILGNIIRRDFSVDSRFYTQVIYPEKSKNKDWENIDNWTHLSSIGYFRQERKSRDSVLDFNVRMDIPMEGTVVTIFSFGFESSIHQDSYGDLFSRAVFNSSWADLSYIASANISSDKELRSRLKCLSESHGVGIVELNLEDIEQSKILFPARRKFLFPARRMFKIVSEAMNKLSGENDDFKEFRRDVLKVAKYSEKANEYLAFEQAMDNFIKGYEEEYDEEFDYFLERPWDEGRTPDYPMEWPSCDDWPDWPWDDEERPPDYPPDDPLADYPPDDLLV